MCEWVLSISIIISRRFDWCEWVLTSINVRETHRIPLVAGGNITGLLRRLVEVYYDLFVAVCLFPYEAVLMASLIHHDTRITSSAKSVSASVYSTLVFVWKGRCELCFAANIHRELFFPSCCDS